MDTETVLHHIRVMKNVTITLDEDLARWARVCAARRDVSVSRLVAELLEERRQQEESFERSRERWLRRKPVPLKAPDERYPSRDEVHDRSDLR